MGTLITNNYSVGMLHCEKYLLNIFKILPLNTGLYFSFFLFKMATLRKRKVLTLESKISILNEVEKGQSPKRNIAKKFENKLSTILKNQEILQESLQFVLE